MALYFGSKFLQLEFECLSQIWTWIYNNKANKKVEITMSLTQIQVHKAKMWGITDRIVVRENVTMPAACRLNKLAA